LPLCGLGRKEEEEKRMKRGQGGGRGRRRRRRIKGAEDPTKIGRQRRKGLLNSCFVILTDLEGRKMLIEEPERGRGARRKGRDSRVKNQEIGAIKYYSRILDGIGKI
jgi:hypothetical protein